MCGVCTASHSPIIAALQTAVIKALRNVGELIWLSSRLAWNQEEMEQLKTLQDCKTPELSLAASPDSAAAVAQTQLSLQHSAPPGTPWSSLRSISSKIPSPGIPVPLSTSHEELFVCRTKPTTLGSCTALTTVSKSFGLFQQTFQCAPWVETVCFVKEIQGMAVETVQGSKEPVGDPRFSVLLSFHSQLL